MNIWKALLTTKMGDDAHPRCCYRDTERIRSDIVAITTEQERLFVADLEKMGETQVRSNLDHGKISPAFVYIASQWLSEREREAERRRETWQAEQIELMKRASAAAERQAVASERANTRATIALIIAITSMIVTAISILVAHWDAHK